MRVTLMHNPRAGEADYTADKLLEALDDAGYEAIYQSVKEEEFASALADPGELVVVAGGDGTVRQISTHLAGRGIPIGLLPLGTANNISRSLGVRGKPQELIQGWASARRQRLDLGVATGPWGETHFMEAVGLGLFPQAMLAAQARQRNPPPTTKRRRATADLEGPDAALHRDLRSLMQRLRAQRAEEMRVTLDGRDASGRYLMVEGMNTNCIGPNLVLAPQADPTDGILDVVLLGERERERLEAYIEDRLEGRDEPPLLPVRAARRLEIEWEGTLVHLDDELWPPVSTEDGEAGRPPPAGREGMRIALERQALEFLIPLGASTRAD